MSLLHCKNAPTHEMKYNMCSKFQFLITRFMCFQNIENQQPLTSDVILQTAHIHPEPIWLCGGKGAGYDRRLAVDLNSGPVVHCVYATCVHTQQWVLGVKGLCVWASVT